MKIDYDPVRDLLYLCFSASTAKAAKTVTIVPGIMADFDKRKKLIGIEVLEASRVVGKEIEFGLPHITSLVKSHAG
ncbi:MAG: DUF2283 domain-containing protein [Candidatus Margulisbacteria bacterium]|nr:DUF2283 domain-containing protein [Candidatus Margulisiibacteriota bacterium]